MYHEFFDQEIADLVKKGQEEGHVISAVEKPGERQKEPVRKASVRKKLNPVEDILCFLNEQEHTELKGQLRARRDDLRKKALQ